MGSPTHSLSAGVQSIVNLKRNDLLRTLLFCAVHNVPQLCALLQPFPEFQAFEQKLMDLTAPSKVNDIIAAVNGVTCNGEEMLLQIQSVRHGDSVTLRIE